MENGSVSAGELRNGICYDVAEGKDMLAIQFNGSAAEVVQV